MLQTLNIGPRIIIAVGGFIAVLGCYLSSYATTFKMFIFLYCMLSSTGFGICTTTHIICAWEWFPNNRGLLTGIISSCTGFGYLYFVQVSTDLVNPESKNPTNYNKQNDVTYFDTSVSDRVPYMLRELCWIWIGFIIAGIIFVDRKE